MRLTTIRKRRQYAPKANMHLTTNLHLTTRIYGALAVREYYYAVAIDFND